MEIYKTYVVYKLNRVMGSDEHLALEEVEFKSTSNFFDTEEEAIQELINDEKKWRDYIILKKVRVSE